MDERDLEIRNSLHSKRACWTRIEDQLVNPCKLAYLSSFRSMFFMLFCPFQLLACRVASLFLVGHTREYVCIPSNIVRNILFEYFPIVTYLSFKYISRKNAILINFFAYLFRRAATKPATHVRVVLNFF